MLKRHFAFFACALAALALVACDDAPESGRATVAVSEINGGTPASTSVSVPADYNVPMEFRFRPYNDLLVISEATPHGDIIIESYRVTWTRADGGAVLPAREEVTSIFLSVYEPNTGIIRLVSAAEKSDPALGTVPVTMIAHLDFKAREMGTEHEIEFSTAVSVDFVN